MSATAHAPCRSMPIGRPLACMLVAAALLLAGAVAGCDGAGGAGGDGALRSKAYLLPAQENDSPLPDGMAALVIFWELGPDQTLVTLEIEDPEPEGAVGLVAHIHANSVEEGGGIAFFLAPVDVQGGGGTSAKLIDRPYNELIAFDGHVNMYEGSSNALVAQGDIGDNAQGRTGEGLDLVADRRSATYALAATRNAGSISDGRAARARFIELTPTRTLVQVALNEGPTGALLTHPAHIHSGRAGEGGDIAIYLSPLDGNGNPANDGAASKIVDRSFDALTAFDGHVTVHQSYNNIQTVIARGNVGANASGE